MDPLTDAVFLAVAKSLAAKVASDSLLPGTKRLIAGVLGEPVETALSRALSRAWTSTWREHGELLSRRGVSPSFLQHEGSQELSKLLQPLALPSAASLASAAQAATAPALVGDAQLDWVIAIRPAFLTLLQAAAQELRREAALEEIMSRIDEAATARSTVAVAQHLGASRADGDGKTDYLVWLLDQHRYLRTTGMVRNTTVQLPLKSVFVGLTCVQERHPGDRTETWYKSEQHKLQLLVQAGAITSAQYEAQLDRLNLRLRRQPTDVPAVTAEDLLYVANHHDRLLVLGEPGSGKTTLLRYLALDACERHLSGDGKTSTGARTRLPVYVRLGDFARAATKAKGLGVFLSSHLDAQECKVPGLRALLDEHLARGECLVLLDGLDEVASADERLSVVRAVTSFMSANSRQGNKFIVTSRIAGYLAAPLPPDFTAVVVQEMEDDTIAAYLGAYCPALERAEAQEKSDRSIDLAAQSDVEEMQEALRANAGVRRLAANPLLLATLLLVHRARGRLPHRRVDAYVEVTEALGRTWRAVQGVPDADLPDDRILTTWLTRLAAWLHESRPEGSASVDELLSVLGPAWARFTGQVWDPLVLEDAAPSAFGPGTSDP